MAKTLTDKAVAKLQPKAKTYHHPDPELRGHYVRVQPSGTRTFAAIARKPDGKQEWATIGAADTLPIEEARKQARRRWPASAPASRPSRLRWNPSRRWHGTG